MTRTVKLKRGPVARRHARGAADRLGLALGRIVVLCRTGGDVRVIEQAALDALKAECRPEEDEGDAREAGGVR